ncbi:MAG: hypothetical protein J6Y19_02185, partial [Kiritimatiellae bacterium]|nr:hypothetical protein [Kiritimatiellia bacterium]
MPPINGRDEARPSPGNGHTISDNALNVGMADNGPPGGRALPWIRPHIFLNRYKAFFEIVWAFSGRVLPRPLFEGVWKNLVA